jgi:sulfur carrier protein
MELKVNGKPVQLERDTSIVQLLEQFELGANTTGVAVAVNDTVVPRGRWNETPLGDGDTVEIIHAVQGG